MTEPEGNESDISGDEECVVWRELDVIRWMRHISKWELHCHVHDPETGKNFTLIKLNKKAYLENFERLIKEKGEWKNESEIPVLAAKEFQKVSQAFKERYERILALPPHPAFPKIFTLDRERGTEDLYVEMEHVEGKSFLHFTAGLNPFQILGLARDLLEGLAFLHQQDIFHRRIKSENICCALEGLKPKARFATWGLAIPPGQAQEDRAGAAYYMAPEVLSGGKITAQSDLWSVGALLYNALTGGPAFPERGAAKNLRELKNIAQDEKRPDGLMAFNYFQKLPPLIAEKLKTERLQELLDNLLKSDPAERPFASAIAVLGFLQTHWPKLFTAAGEFYETISLSV